MECYKKTYIAIWIPILIVLGAYVVSSMAALSEHPEPERSLSNVTDHELEMLALMTKCQCIEGNIFCSSTEALTHCKCGNQVGDTPASVVCEDDDHDDHDDHDHDDHDHDDHGHGDHDSHDSEMSMDGDKPWGKTIIVCLIINLTTLTGTFVTGGHWVRNLICPSWNPDPAVGALWANVIIPMFAAGTLLSTTFFLLFPEALHIIQDGLTKQLEADMAAGKYDDHDDHDHDDHAHRYRMLGGGHDDHGDEPHVEEAQVTWRWGASILGGFLFPVLVHAFFPNPAHNHDHDHTHDEDEAENVEKTAPDAEDAQAAAAASTDPEKVEGENATENGSSEVAAEEDDEYVRFCGIRLKNLSLFLSYNLGEALHNFTDGIFVGAAYMGCGSTMGNSVALATIVHEIPNQLAGYLVMINQNGIPPCMALFLNFVFGLIVIVGGLLVLIVEPNDTAVGSIFALGGGIFLHVAISEMLGTAERNIVHKRQWLYVFLAFFVGTIVIGLVLINHTHCGGHHH